MPSFKALREFWARWYELITVQWDQDSWVGHFAKKYVVWLEFYEFLTREAKFWRFWKLTKWAFYKYCHFWKDSLYVLSYHWLKAQLGEKLRKHVVKFPTYFRLPANDDASINLYTSINIFYRLDVRAILWTKSAAKANNMTQCVFFDR